MSFSLSNIFHPQTTTYAPATGPTAPTSPTGGTTYHPDGFAASYGIQTSASNVVKQPLESLVDDPGAASRFHMLFIKSSEGLLKVGGDGGSFGRFFLNVLAGAVPLFTPAAKRAEISANVMNWVGRADLVRSGCSPTDARLLQSAGISNITDLSRMGNPMDQMTLLSRMSLAAMQWGTPIPTPQLLATWVTAAQSLPPRIH